MLRYSLTILVLLLGACANHRVSIPVGEIPTQHEVSAEDEQFGHEVLNQLSSKYQLDSNDFRIERVRAVADRLTRAAGVDQNPWHVYVLQDDSFQNAAATRGNFVFVWTGLLSTVKNDDELATILAHEISHVLAGHTQPNPSEEVSEMLSGVAGQIAGSVAYSQGVAPVVVDLAQIVMREALKAFLVNPEDQRKELEADQIGLFMMADAGYDPEEALAFWNRVKDQPGFSGFPLQFMSSHPSSEERITQIEQLLPEARDRFAHSLSRGGDKSITHVPSKKSEWTWERDTKTRQPPPHDSFATKSTPRRSATFDDRTASRRDGSHKLWEVTGRQIHVFSDPDTLSGTTGKLVRGTQVVVERELNQESPRGTWLEISNPIRGFVMSGDLKPVIP